LYLSIEEKFSSGNVSHQVHVTASIANLNQRKTPCIKFAGYKKNLSYKYHLPHLDPTQQEKRSARATTRHDACLTSSYDATPPAVRVRRGSPASADVSRSGIA
jgi:hypothetical protein